MTCGTMSAEDVEYVALSRPADPVVISDSETPYVAFGDPNVHTEFNSAISRVVTVLQAEGTHACLLPVGETGCLRWSRLPREIARLCAPPTCDSVLALPRERAAGLSSGGALWETLGEIDSERIHVGKPLEGGESAEGIPLLAPPTRALPRWLRDAADAVCRGAPSQIDAAALQAGLYQVHDALEQSHEFSQSVQGQGRHSAGDYWHAIMHRREPDYGNSKYWFRRVGRHPIFAELKTRAEDILGACEDAAAGTGCDRMCAGEWDPFAFVDFCQHCARQENSPLAVAARRIQWIEMLLLLEQTCQDAGL